MVLTERLNWFRDRDIVQDGEGCVYTVLGHIQPPQHVLVFLKYVPDEGGRWRSSGKTYRRVFWGGVESVISAESQIPRDFLRYDSHFGTVLPEIHVSSISSYFLPDRRLESIVKNGPADILEKRALRLAEAIHDVLHIPLERIGVGGSVAWNAHDPEISDVNMNVYGLENGWRLEHGYDTLAEEAPYIELRPESEWVRSKQRLLGRSTHLTMSDLQTLFERRRALCIDGFSIGVTPILMPDEAPILHGSEVYRNVSPQPIRTVMTIHDDTFSIFLPSILYGISDPIELIHPFRVTRLMIYEGAYRGLLRSGDRIEVCGMLQRVDKVPRSDSEPLYQVMVGTMKGAGQEYIRFL